MAHEMPFRAWQYKTVIEDGGCAVKRIESTL